LSGKLLIYIASKLIAQKIGNIVMPLFLLIKYKSSGAKKYFLGPIFGLYNSQIFLQTRVNYSRFTISLYKSIACEPICHIHQAKKG
jgi:hypothetical protein